MFKRPILVAAIVVALLSLAIINLFPQIIYHDEGLTEESEYCIISTVYKIEEKTYSYYFFAHLSDFPFRKIILVINKSSNLDWSEIRIGNTLKCNAEFVAFSVARNHGNYNEKSYYQSLGICAKYEVQDFSIYNSHVDYVSDLAYRLKMLLSESISSIAGSASSNAAGTLSAMVTGDKSDLADNVKDIYASNGISHILAISGLHISIIGMGIFKILRKKFGYQWAALVASAIVLFYSILSGMSPSAIRASIMLFMRIGAIGLGKKYDMLCSLSIAAILLLFDNPFYLNNSGFQMSFAAIVSLAVIPDALLKFFNIDSFECSRKHKYEFKLLSGFFSSVSVTLATLPIILVTYYGFPLYGIIINILVVPIFSYIVPDALLGGLVGALWKCTGKILIGVGVYLVSLIDIICDLFSSFPMAYVITGNISSTRIIIYYFFLLFIIGATRIDRIRKINVKFKILAFIICLILFHLLIALKPAGSNSLNISFIDVDQGECILIKSPSGLKFMIDCGSTGTKQVYKYRVESTLKYYGIETIDYLLISHPDTDHISGVIEMLEGDGDISIKNIIAPCVEDNEEYINMINLCESSEVTLLNAVSGMKITDKDLTLRCLSPNIQDKAEDNNDNSAVWVMEYRGFTGLFTGDISAEKERFLLDNGSLISDITLLDVAHHGSKNSSSIEFLNYCNPGISVISAGVDNIYGHPHINVIKRLESIGSAIYCTSQCGEINITVSYDGTVKLDTFLN